MTKDLLDPIVSTGVVGAVCVVLGYVVFRLWGELNAEKASRIDDAKAARKEIDEVHRARITDAQTYADAIREMITDTTRAASALEDVSDRLVRQSQVDREELAPTPTSARLTRTTPNEAFRPHRPRSR